MPAHPGRPHRPPGPLGLPPLRCAASEPPHAPPVLCCSLGDTPRTSTFFASLLTLWGYESARLAPELWGPIAGDALATCSYDGTWRLWDTGTGVNIMEQEGHSRAVYSIAFHPDGSLCGSGGFDAVARVWDCRTGRSVLTFQGHTYGVLAMAFSPNGYHVATGAALPV